MATGTLNGCGTKTYSRMSKMCRTCQYKEYCNRKRMEAMAAADAQVKEHEHQLDVAFRQLGAAAASAGTSAEDFGRACRDAMNAEERRRAGIWM